MSEKRETLEGVYSTVLQGPRDRGKAELPESQFPVAKLAAHRYSAYIAMPSGANRGPSAICNLRLMDDEERLHSRR
jgi:hypothetical protein